MPQEKLPEGMPAFLDANTLEDMSEVAEGIAMARSFVKLIVETEDELLMEDSEPAKGHDVYEMKRIVEYATVAANAARDAKNILRSIKANVEAYRGSI